MKKLVLLSIFVWSNVAFSQNQAPIALNDTLHYSFGTTHKDDSLNIDLYGLLHNDYDPDGPSVRIESILYSGPNAYTVLKPGSYIFSIHFKPQFEFTGLDTFQYVIIDVNGSPIKRDTASVALYVGPKNYAVLEANNINASITSDALFTHGSKEFPGFEAPANSNLFTMYAANLWVAGTLNGTVYSNARKFGSSNTFGPGYTSNPGPVSNVSHTTAMLNSPWNRVWKMSKTMIEDHLDNYQNVGYTAPDEILEWPTHGIIIKGEAPFLAPYFDHNQDSLYNPYDGDYPIIKGDEAIYFIYNDGNSPISAQPMISEVHGMAYAFSCGDSAIQNTIFVDYRIFNRSSNTYANTSFGMWADVDLGNAQDDFAGCDVMRNCFYAYNGDDFDDPTALSNGYGAHAPAIGTVLLKGPPQDFDGVDNDFGVGVNESVNGFGFGDGIADNELWGLEFNQVFVNGLFNVDTDLGVYQSISGLDPTNNPLAGFINGASTTTPYKYIYPGESDPLYYGTFGTPIPNWTEHTEGNAPSDRRILGSTGGITFKPGDEIKLTYAFVFGRDYVNTGAQAGVQNMLARVDSIQSYYRNGLLSACGDPVSVGNPIKNETSIEVYPNPARDRVFVKQKGTKKVTISILDMTGKIVHMESSNEITSSINLTRLSKGIYLIRVSSDGFIETARIVKE